MAAISELASAFVTIAPSAKGFGSSLNNQVGGSIRSSGKSLGAVFGKTFALGAGVIAAAGIGSFLKGSIDEAREAQKVGAVTANVIKQTGGAAKITAAQVGDLATSFSNVTGIDDEVIQGASNLLLTFKNVKNEVGEGANIFDRATRAAADLSAAGFGDINGAAKQLGKALNDPIKGITALSRSGVTFTAEQQKQIKSMVENGNLLGAQKILLGEVNTQVGGAAVAASTFGEKASVAFGNVKEQVGTALLPVIDRFFKLFVSAVPQITKIISGIGPAITGVGGLIGPAFAAIFAAIGGKAGLIGAFQAVVSYIQTTIIPAFQNLGTIAMPLVLQAAGLIVPAFNAIQGALSALGPTFLAVTGFLAQHGTAVRAVVVAILAGVAAFKIIAIAARAYAVVQGILNVVLTANPIGVIIIALVALAAGLVYAYKNSDKFRAVVDRTFKAIKKVVTTVINFVVPFVKNHWQLLLAIIGGPLGIIVGLVIKNFGKIKAFISATVNAVIATAHKFSQFATVVGENVGKAIKFFKELPGKIKGFFTGLPAELKTLGGNIIDGLKEGIKAAGQKVLDAVQGIIDKIPKFIRKRLGIASPSKVTTKLGEYTSEGLARGIANGAKKAADAAKKLVDGVKDALKGRISGLQDDFSSLADSVSSAFTGNLFEATNAGDFIKNLLGTQGQLQSLKAAFKTLLGYGLQPGFLSQLFASGNAGLILDLAAQDQATATQAGALFGNVTDLSSQLGNNVAQADVGPKLDKQIDLLQQLVGLSGGQAVALAKEINGAATGGKKKGNKGKGKK